MMLSHVLSLQAKSEFSTDVEKFVASVGERCGLYFKFVAGRLLATKDLAGAQADGGFPSTRPPPRNLGIDVVG